MGYLFVAIEGMTNPSITATDSTSFKAKDYVWHKSSIMEKGIVPRSGIDMDARWGYSHIKGWIFGYKLHLTCTTGEIVVPSSSRDVTTANVPDNQMYVSSTTSSPVFSIIDMLYGS